MIDEAAHTTAAK
ncbi:hypothetical protein A2U01_0107473, partial [Trifolium medium]|nr:hypothetical protein [Trifolium medium]